MSGNRTRIIALTRFCEEHLQYKPLVFGHTTGKTSVEIIYARAAAAGLHWSVKDRVWYDGPARTRGSAQRDVSQSSTPQPILQIAPPTSANGRAAHVEIEKEVLNRDYTFVRIMAHKSVIDQAVADWIELAEVQDMEVAEISRHYANHGDIEWHRVYVKVRKHYSPI